MSFPSVKQGRMCAARPAAAADEKFGKIFIAGKGDTTGTPTELDCLEGVRFSNKDWQWYDSNGEPHVEYAAKFGGSSYFYQFNLWNKDVHGEEMGFCGRLLSCFPLGELPTSINVRNLESLDDAQLEWALDIGLLLKNDTPNLEKFERIRTGSLASVLTPGLLAQNTTILRMFISTFYIVDNVCLEVMGAKPYRKLHEIAAAVADVMRGEREWQDSSFADKIRPFLHATHLMRAEALKHVSEQEAAPMFEAYAEHVFSYAVENCVEWKGYEREDPALLFRHGQPKLRLVNSGYSILLELLLANCGIVIERNVRSSFLFKHFKGLCELHMATLQDLMSFRMELQNGETNNIVYILHAVDGLPLETALETTLSRINSLAEQIVTLGNVLRDLFFEIPEVGRFVHLAKLLLQTHFHYYPLVATRYGHDNIVFDCIVVEQK